MKKPPLVTITPAVWRALVVQATAHEREGGGMLVGRAVRGGGIHVVHEVGMTHIRADDSSVIYDAEEVSRARFMVHEAHGPRYNPVGRWHSHPWPACNADALLPQITQGFDGADFEDMLVGDLELICSTFPDPGYVPKHSEFEVQRKLGGTYCRAEIWLRKNGKPIPCPVTVRRVE